jgi:hypothetical protein
MLGIDEVRSFAGRKDLLWQRGPAAPDGIRATRTLGRNTAIGAAQLR